MVACCSYEEYACWRGAEDPHKAMHVSLCRAKAGDVEDLCRSQDLKDVILVTFTACDLALWRKCHEGAPLISRDPFLE